MTQLMEGHGALERPLGRVSKRSAPVSARGAWVRVPTLTRVVSIVACLLGARIVLAEPGYPFPMRSDDLAVGEYWVVINDHYDLHVVRYDMRLKKWTRLRRGVREGEARPKDHLAYGLPVRAIASGEVVTCWRNAPDNPLGKPHAGRDGCDNRCEFSSSCSCTIPRPGNHLNVLSPDGRMILYAHLEPGSVPERLCPHNDKFIGNAKDKSGPNGHNPGAYVAPGQRPRIVEGDIIGRVGHSGASSDPHLHNHIVLYPSKNKIPLEYRGIWTQEKPKAADISQRKWRRVDGESLTASPKHLILPGYTSGLREVARHGVSPMFFDFDAAQLGAAGYQPVWFDAYRVDNEVFYNYVWRSATTRWRFRRALSKGEYDAEWRKAFDDGFSPIHAESYLNVEDKLRYAAIYVKDGSEFVRGGHDMTREQHRALMGAANSAGLSPVSVSVVSVGGERRYTALYRKVDIGDWQIHSRILAGDFQRKSEDLAGIGLKPHYAAAYRHESKTFYSVVFASKPNEGLVAQYDMGPKRYQRVWESAGASGKLTRAVSGVDGLSTHRFIAIWQ